MYRIVTYLNGSFANSLFRKIDVAVKPLFWTLQNNSQKYETYFETNFATFRDHRYLSNQNNINDSSSRKATKFKNSKSRIGVVTGDKTSLTADLILFKEWNIKYHEQMPTKYLLQDIYI